MMLLMKLVLGLAFLGVLVVFHELGHFLVARAFGIRVERFSVGFGKSLLKWQRGDTTWSFAAVPLGGYVRMAGEHPDDENCTGAPDEFMSKIWWQRFCVVVAGPLANLVFALLAFSLIGLVGIPIPLQSTQVELVDEAALAAGFLPGDQIEAVDGVSVDNWYNFQLEVQDALDGAEVIAVTVTRAAAELDLELERSAIPAALAGMQPWAAPKIGRVAIGNPAYQAGLRDGDRVVVIDGEPVSSWNEMRERIISRPNEDIPLTIERDGVELEVEVHSLAQEDATGQMIGLIGITMDTPNRRFTLPLGESIREGVRNTGRWIVLAYSGLWRLVSDFSEAKNNIAGPITIVHLAGSSAGPSEALNLLAVISIFLMTINLLPIPILDGGHALFCLIEGVRGGPLTMRSQLAMQKVGLVVIGSLLVLALWNDTRRGAERLSSVRRLERQATTTEQP